MTAPHPPWLKTAIKYVGYKEGPNNDNRFGKALGLNNEPWCDLFVAETAKESGHPLPSMQPGMSTGAAAVFYSIEYAKSHGLWVPSWEAKPGFQICYGWNGPRSAPADMHTGWVVSSGPQGSTGRTVEGNRADQVERQTFTVGESVVLGCIDIPRLLLGREKIVVKPTPQPRHPQHPHNTGPHPLGTLKQSDAAAIIAELARRKKPLPHGKGSGRGKLRALAAQIKRLLRLGRKK